MTRDAISPGIGFIRRISKNEHRPKNSKEHGRIACFADCKLHIGLLLYHVHCPLLRCRRILYRSQITREGMFDEEAAKGNGFYYRGL